MYHTPILNSTGGRCVFDCLLLRVHRRGSGLVVGLLGRDRLSGLLLLLGIVRSRVGVDGCRLLGRRGHGVGDNGLLGIVLLLLLLLGGDGILSRVSLGLLLVVGDGSDGLQRNDTTGGRGSLLGIEVGRNGRGCGRLVGDGVETLAAVLVEGEAVDGGGGNVEEADNKLATSS